MSETHPDPTRVLREAKTVAVVGISTDPDRTSHLVARYLQEAGYTVIPVNPGHETILGVTCYPDLPAVPGDIEIDIVDIFRRPEHTAGVVAQVLERAKKTGNSPVVWTQIGVSSAEARELAESRGLTYIANACTMATHKQMRRVESGRMSSPND